GPACLGLGLTAATATRLPLRAAGTRRVYACRVPPAKRITREGVLARITASFAGDVAPTMEELSAAAGVSRTVLYSLFGSRAGLLEAMGADVPAASSARITAAAAELVAERGLAGLSLDEVAHRAGVSRATVYRLYPGKSALFGEVVRTYLAVDEALGLLERLADRPPAEVMPLLARALTQSGSIRIGLLRTVLLEVTRGVEGTEEVLQETYENTKVMIGYIERQMAPGGCFGWTRCWPCRSSWRRSRSTRCRGRGWRTPASSRSRWRRRSRRWPRPGCGRWRRRAIAPRYQLLLRGDGQAVELRVELGHGFFQLVDVVDDVTVITVVIVVIIPDPVDAIVDEVRRVVEDVLPQVEDVHSALPVPAFGHGSRSSSDRRLGGGLGAGAFPHVEGGRGALAQEPVELGVDGRHGFAQIVDLVFEVVPVVVADAVDGVVHEVVGVVHEVLPEVEQADATAATATAPAAAVPAVAAISPVGHS